jgi:predicted CXXCH cytochrome family protein
VCKLKKYWITSLFIAFILFASLAFSVKRVSAQTVPPTPAGTANDQACLDCHGNPGLETKLPSGEILYLSIDSETYNHSVHGDQGYACTQCHANISGFPHPALQAATRRDVTLELNQVCAQCHQNKFDAAVNDAHTLAREAGNKEAAVCTDCHGTHDITSLSQPRSRIPQTCEKCHSQIFNLYKDSVHGAALLGEGNPDVPSCVDCHNAHNVQGPSNTQFRLFSPQICARCHANKTLMDKYGINTNVFNSYLSDFHGTTVEMFQAVAPGQETNKPVCIDCHGVHDIKAVSDANSTVIKEHILVTCQKCHPGASPNFPTAWLSHYQPSPQHSPVVYYVGIFYRFFIPTVLGGMALFVFSDAGRRLVNKRKKKITKISKPEAESKIEVKPEAGIESTPEKEIETETEREAEIKSPVVSEPETEIAPDTGTSSESPADISLGTQPESNDQSSIETDLENNSEMKIETKHKNEAEDSEEKQNE